MSVVIIGGHDRMVSQYKKICKEHSCKAKVCSSDAGKLQKSDRKPGSYYSVYQYRIPQDGEMCGDRSRKIKCRCGEMPHQQRKCAL